MPARSALTAFPAARISEGGTNLEAATAATLPPGILTPGLQQANFVDRAKLLSALRDLLAAVAGRSRDICLVVPDSTTRVMLLDFDTLPDKQADADAVVRFRLKKSLPFDIEESAVSFERQGSATQARVIAAVTPRVVLDEYEGLIRRGRLQPRHSAAFDAGCPGIGRCLPSDHGDQGGTGGRRTFAIVDQDQLLLYRSLDNGDANVTGESLADDVNTSLVYFEDRYGVNVERVLVTGVQSPQDLQAHSAATSAWKN